ncbi:MAG: hypothetical protein ACRDN9_01250 [Streptosporangiaceae bacterium]
MDSTCERRARVWARGGRYSTRFRRNPDGSADLAGLNLPVDRVAAAAARIDALAKAAKRAGSHRPIDHLRAELFLGMTDGAYTGLDDAAILATLLSAGGDDDGDGGDTGAGEDIVAGSGLGGDRGDGEKGDDAGGGSGDRAPETHASAGNRGGIELRVRLSTLLGRDQHPAEIAGWGPLHADLARDLIPTLPRAEWRFVVTDTAGHLRHVGITRARPAGTPAGGGRSGDVVELQVPATLLETHPRDEPPEPIIEPLPGPIPGQGDPSRIITPVDDDWTDDHILERPAPKSHPPPSGPRYDLDTDPPPF